MKKIKFDKAAVLTIVSAVCGVGGFIANALSSKDEEESLQSRHSKNKNKVSNTSPQMDYQFSKAEVDERQTESDQVHNKKRKKKRRLQKKKVIKEENEENDD